MAWKRSSKSADWIGGHYVAVPHEMMDHYAFRSLSEAAIRVLLHSMRKAYGSDRYLKIFKFTYPEANKRLHISDSTFRRAMRQLHKVGFIDYYSPGGLRCEIDPNGRIEGKRKDPKGYQLSLRWKKYGTASFEEKHEGYYTSIHG